MRVLIIGANGKIGQQLVSEMQNDSNFSPVAMVRQTIQYQTLLSQGIETALGNLENSVDSLSKLMIENKIEAVVFTAGSGGHTGADKTVLIDLDGAIKSMKAAKQSGIERFVIISSFASNLWHENHVPESVKSLGYYSAAKFYADEWLKNSSLDYTIIRPGRLTDNQATGHIQIGQLTEASEISRADVANVIIEVLNNEQTIKKDFDVVNGSTPIALALKQI